MKTQHQTRSTLVWHGLIVLVISMLSIPSLQALPPQQRPRADKKVSVRTADTLRTQLGEGAIWNSLRNTLFWVDIEGHRLYELIPSQRQCNHWEFEGPVSTVVPETDSTVIIALQNRIERFNLQSQQRDTLAQINDKNGKLRCNDGKCDPAGRFWIGTMAYDGTPDESSLYSIDADGQVTVQIGSVSLSNGIVWTPDRTTMYYIDTPTRQVSRYRYDETSGQISFEEISIIVPEAWGVPDGMTIDREGKLWIAHWGGHGVYQWDPVSGELLRFIEVPAPNVTSCAFGGPNFDTLYITTAACSAEESEQYPLSGSLFVCKPGTQGIESYCFGKKN